MIDKLTEEKRKTWEEVITYTNMTHNSRKAWKTIRKLSNDPTTSNPPCLVSANQVAHQFPVNGSGNHAIQAEASCITSSNRKRLLNGTSFQRKRVQERSGNTEEQQSLRQILCSGGTTKESWSQSPQMAADNAKHMLHGK